MCTCLIFLYLAESCSEWEIFQTKFAEEINNTRFTFDNFFRKSHRLWDNVEKCSTAEEVTDNNIIRRMRVASG